MKEEKENDKQKKWRMEKEEEGREVRGIGRQWKERKKRMERRMREL